VNSWDPDDRIVPTSGTNLPPLADAQATVHHLNISSLKAFVEDAFSYHCQRIQGLREEEPTETLQLSDEPLASDSLSLSSMQKFLFPRICQNLWEDQKKSLEELVEDVHQNFVWSSQSPEGALAKSEKLQLLDWGEMVVEELTELHSQCGDWELLLECDFSLGNPKLAPQWQGTLANGHTFEVQGRIGCALLAPLDQPPQLTLLGLGRVDKFPGEKNNIQLHLQAALVQACGFSGPIELLCVNRKADPKKMSITIAPDLAVLQNWLTHILTEIAQGACDYLPFTHVVAQREANLEELREKIEKDEYLNVVLRLLDPSLEGESTQEEKRYWQRALQRFAPFMNTAKGETKP
jgi:hypothetical protein